MNRHIFFAFLSTVFLLGILFCHHECYGSFQNLITGPHRGFIGPEIYHMKRIKKSGSQQTGWLYGGSALYERLKNQGCYWALSGYYTYGCLTGKTAPGDRLKSKLSETEIEGRLGYSFCLNQRKSLSLTPYAGYGSLYSKNQFVAPSPFVYTFHDRFHYGAVGLLSSICLTPSLETGFDFKAKFMVEGKSIVAGDPDNDKVSLLMENETHYEINIPTRYHSCWKNYDIIVSLVPFYRFRHYGGRESYPSHFVDTKFHIYGGKCIVHLCF